jgi:hypothetical protein
VLTKLARGPSSRQTVSKASRMGLLGAALWYPQEKRWCHSKGQKGGGSNDRSWWLLVGQRILASKGGGGEGEVGNRRCESWL